MKSAQVEFWFSTDHKNPVHVHVATLEVPIEPDFNETLMERIRGCALVAASQALSYRRGDGLMLNWMLNPAITPQRHKADGTLILGPHPRPIRPGDILVVRVPEAPSLAPGMAAVFNFMFEHTLQDLGQETTY